MVVATGLFEGVHIFNASMTEKYDIFRYMEI
jgi:hypothetical protein